MTHKLAAYVLFVETAIMLPQEQASGIGQRTASQLAQTLSCDLLVTLRNSAAFSTTIGRWLRAALIMSPDNARQWAYVNQQPIDAIINSLSLTSALILRAYTHCGSNQLLEKECLLFISIMFATSTLAEVNGFLPETSPEGASVPTILIYTVVLLVFIYLSRENAIKAAKDARQAHQPPLATQTDDQPPPVELPSISYQLLRTRDGVKQLPRLLAHLALNIKAGWSTDWCIGGLLTTYETQRQGQTTMLSPWQEKSVYAMATIGAFSAMLMPWHPNAIKGLSYLARFLNIGTVTYSGLSAMARHGMPFFAESDHAHYEQIVGSLLAVVSFTVGLYYAREAKFDVQDQLRMNEKTIAKITKAVSKFYHCCSRSPELLQTLLTNTNTQTELQTDLLEDGPPTSPSQPRTP